MAKLGGTRRLSRMDILIVAAACLLLVLLVPALFAGPRERANRILCGANLGQIGKMMLIYANDYEGALPRAGGPTSVWGPVANWAAVNRYAAYGMNPSTGDGGAASFSSCLYLLVKYCKTPPRVFICKGDFGTKEFRLSDVPEGILLPRAEFSDLWDFGPTMAAASRACSYSYHVPLGLFGLTTARDPNLAVAADRNPWLNSPGAAAKPFPGTGSDQFRPDIAGYGGSSATARNGNAITHQSDGQNVLFLDGRVTFETRPYCGVMSGFVFSPQRRPDNIYTVSDMTPTGSPFGTVPVCFIQPASAADSLLLHDDPASGISFERPPRTR